MLATVIRDSDDDFLEVSDDSTKIRRSPSHPLPAESQFEKRAIYAKGWNLKGTTIDSVEKYFADKGYKVRVVNLRCFNRPMCHIYRVQLLDTVGFV